MDASERSPISGVPSAPSDRGELLAAVTFVEGTRNGWGAWDLTGWFDDYLVSPERMVRPAIATEGGGVVALDPRSPAAGMATLSPAELPRLVSAARARIVATLRLFVCAPFDDRFLNAAIFSGRVVRLERDGCGAWVARPRESDRLSDIVLSLFAADVLMHREFHEANLCVCEVCGRISFAPAVFSRNGCREHPPHGANDSGFYRRLRSTTPTTAPGEGDGA